MTISDQVKVPESASSAIECSCGDDLCIEVEELKIGESIGATEIWSYLRSNSRFNYLVLSAVISLVGIVIYTAFGDQSWLPLIWIISVGTGLIVPLQLTWKSLKKKTLTINTLLSVAAMSSLVLGLYEEAVILVIVFSVGEIMESVLVRVMQRELDVLKNIIPTNATILLDDGSTEVISTDEIQKGQRFRVNTGALVPVDGINLDTEIEIQKAHISGESVPEVVDVGGKVFAGSIIIGGSTSIQATVDAGGSHVHDIVKSVEDSLSRKSSAEDFSKKFGSLYTPIVFIFALLIALLVPTILRQSYELWIMRALVILVVSCACGLAVSVPVTVVSTVTSAAKRQILIRGGAALEKIDRIQAIIFDKTGTLTFGRPKVRGIHHLTDLTEVEQSDINTLLLAMSEKSDHPISKSIQSHLSGAIKAAILDEFSEVPGKGMMATTANDRYKLIRDEGGMYQQHVIASYNEACTYSVLWKNDVAIALVVLEDNIRPGAKAVISRLNSMGIKTIMITGDSKLTAQHVANQLGITDFKAEVLPEEKKIAVQELQKQYGTVAMVGDGINDAPALAESDVGIAMGHTGTEIAAEVADVVLVDDEIVKIVQTMGHAKFGFAVAKQNIVLALLTVASLLLLAAIGYLDLVSGIVANEGTAILIIANGLRMLKFRG